MAQLHTSLTEQEDMTWISENIEKCIIKPFTDQNIKEVFEMCPWSLSVRREDNLIAFAAFTDYPAVKYESSKWVEELQSIMNSQEYDGLNTLFLHVFMCDAEPEACMQNILKETFSSIPSLKWCCILTEGSVIVDPVISENFKQENRFESGTLQFWHVNRHNYIPNVGIRSKKSEDYLALRNLFSQMYPSFRGDSLQNFTLDFLDFGEDRCPAYKYFTYDEDNTYIGVADIEGGEAIGFIYATTQHADLDMMNAFFQLEAVYGLRKKHPSDKPEISFESEYVPMAPEMSSDEEEEVIRLTMDLLQEVESNWEIITCLYDILDEICETKDSAVPETAEKLPEEKLQLLFNSETFDLSNDDHSAMITSKNLKYFNSDTLVRLINSKSFDATNATHMTLVSILGKAIANISPERIDEIISSDEFDPSDDKFARISLCIIEKMPQEKLEMFCKSSIGSAIYEKAIYKKAQAKAKTQSRELSYSEIQIIRREKKKMERLPSEKEISTENIVDPVKSFNKGYDFKKISYRNMGFISGLAVRGKYRIQKHYSLPKIKEPFGFIEKEDHLKKQSELDFNVDAYERYPVPHREESYLTPSIPVYNGRENCFFIEQFAIEKDYESESLFLIMAAFNYFPRVDYCMLLLPFGTKQVPYLRRHFTQIPARPFSTYGKELYIYHKNGFHWLYHTRRYEQSDFQGVRNLIMYSCLKENLMQDLEKTITPTDIQMDAVVLISENEILGIAIVSEIKEVEIIKRNYDIAEREKLKYHKYRKHGLLLHCVLHPVAKFLSNVFLKEVMRISQKSILYYKIYPSHVIPYNPSLWQSLCNVLEHLLPLRPIKKTSARLSITVNTTNEKVNNENEKDKCYSLCYISKKLVLRDKRINSSRIAVLGNSCTALGILESLLYNSNNRFINLTMITRNSIPSEFRFDAKCYSFLPLRTDYTQSLIDSLCLPAWITVVRGDLVAIEENQVRLMEIETTNRKQFSVGFDYLVVCVDLEFQTTHIKKVVPQKKFSTVQKKFPMLKYLWQYEYTISGNATNVYTVNCVEDATKVFNWLWRYFLRKAEMKNKPKVYKSFTEKERDMRDSRVIIYGRHMEAYTSLAVILTERFPHSKVTFVKPPPDVGKSGFYSSHTEEAFDFVIQNSELEVYFNATLLYDKESQVYFVDLIMPEETLRLDCCAVLIFDSKSTNHIMLKALHHSDVAYVLPLRNPRGHPYLLINTEFQTNIENIFAVGNITQMHSKDGSSVRFEECIYNPREIGIIVGNNISKKVEGKPKLNNNSFPIFKSPFVTYAKLPFGYVYIYIAKPSQLIHTDTGAEEIAMCPEEIVLGNLKTGAAIIPQQTSEKNDVKLDEDKNGEIEHVSSDKSIPQTEAEFEEVLADDSFLQQEEILEDEQEESIKKILPAEPEYFSLTFDQSAHVANIECLTKTDVQVDSLIQLNGVHVTQLYNILRIIKEEDSERVSFSLTDDWILPLDYLTFADKDTSSEEKQKFGYEGYWRRGYPESEQPKLNGFLDSFAKIKSKK